MFDYRSCMQRFLSNFFQERFKKHARLEERQQIKHKTQMKDLHRKLGKEAGRRDRAKMGKHGGKSKGRDADD